MSTRSAYASPPKDPETSTGVVKVPFKKIGAVVGAITAIVVLFNLIIPSKIMVEHNAQRITTLEMKVEEQHDLLIKISKDVEYIRLAVDQRVVFDFSPTNSIFFTR